MFYADTCIKSQTDLNLPSGCMMNCSILRAMCQTSMSGNDVRLPVRSIDPPYDEHNGAAHSAELIFLISC
eukprot:3428319-Pyramimonas_sp.AAC.1